jgi:hypothetical protein
MEAQLDYFGSHSFDIKDEGAGTVKKGRNLDMHLLLPSDQ